MWRRSLARLSHVKPIAESPHWDSVGLEKGNFPFANYPVSSISRLPPLSRYLPSDAKAFLVEKNRLDPAERISQGISTAIPWMIFIAFACSPFFVMKYNLDRLESKTVNESEPQLVRSLRTPFRRVSYASIPEIIERRHPTLIFVLSGDFFSVIVGLFAKELDRILDNHGISTSVCVLDYDSADSGFRSRNPIAPLAHLISPGEKLVEFPGPWNLRAVLDFLVPPSRVSESMVSEVLEAERKLARLRECLFRKRFVEKDQSWTLEASLSENSIESAIVRCETTRS